MPASGTILHKYCIKKKQNTTKPHRKTNKIKLLICLPPFISLSSVPRDCYYTRPAFENTKCSFSCPLNHFFIANPIIQFYNFHRLIESVKVVWKVDASDLPLPAASVEYSNCSRQTTRRQNQAKYIKAQENKC